MKIVDFHNNAGKIPADMKLSDYELGRLDGWYNRLPKTEIKNPSEYQAGYHAGSTHADKVRTWIRSHPSQSPRLDTE